MKQVDDILEDMPDCERGGRDRLDSEDSRGEAEGCGGVRYPKLNGECNEIMFKEVKILA